MKIGNYNVDIDTNQVKDDLTATHADGTKLSIWEKVKLLIKHNPMVIIAIIYSISPIDLIPDVIPIVGSLDDTIALLIPMLKLFQEVMDANSRAMVNNSQAEITLSADVLEAHNDVVSNNSNFDSKPQNEFNDSL